MGVGGAAMSGMGAMHEAKAAKASMQKGDMGGAMKHAAAAMKKGMEAYQKAPPAMKKMMVAQMKKTMVGALGAAA